MDQCINTATNREFLVMFPCLCVLHTDCSHGSSWMVTLHVSSSKHWITQGCQCRTPMLHTDATHSSSLASNFYHKLKSFRFVIISIVTVQNVCEHALFLSHSPNNDWHMNSLNTHHLNITSTCTKGKLVKGSTLVNVFLATSSTLLKNFIFIYNHNFTDGVPYLNQRNKYSSQKLIIPYLVNFQTPSVNNKTATHCHTLYCCQF